MILGSQSTRNKRITKQDMSWFYNVERAVHRLLRSQAQQQEKKAIRLSFEKVRQREKQSE